MSIIRTHNPYHLGDHLVHLNFMRRAALANPEHTFIHHAADQYLHQLRDLVEDIPNLKLEEFTHMTPHDSINAWRGVDRIWYDHKNRNDFVSFHLEWFELLAKKMKIENPIKTPKDMLFDYPSIRRPIESALPIPFDVLVINSAPGSGQFQNYNAYELSRLARVMGENGFKVICTSNIPNRNKNVFSTMDENLSVTKIGHLSLHCPTILMVSTGPSWPTFNIWNTESVTNRIILLTEERIYLTPNTHHCSEIYYATEILRNIGLL
jgi:hypothetical protein